MNNFLNGMGFAVLMGLILFCPVTILAADSAGSAEDAMISVEANVSTPVGPEHTVYFSEDWEDGQGFWIPSNGVWEVGTHSTVQGEACAATNLNGNYPEHTNSRLISPTIQLPNDPTDGSLWLRFWHYFKLANDGDYARTEISVDGGAWVTVGNTFRRSGQTWTPHLISLDSYAGESVRIAFYMYDSDDYPYAESSGWYLDEIEIFDGDFAFTSPESFDLGKYDPDWGGWSTTGGLWEFGTPTYGTGKTASGRYCAGTNLDGGYAETGNSRLMSPAINLPAAPLNGNLFLSFMHFYNFATDGDYGIVEIYTEESGWVQLGGDFRNYSGAWCEYITDIAAYAGQTVYLGFHFVDSYDYPYAESSGWYIDDVAIVEGPTVFNNPDNFEGGCRGWYSTRGNWQIGTPTSGPGSAYSGDVCWGTRMAGNYVQNGSSHLITPQVTLTEETPGNPLYLRFQHWYSFATDGDYGAVYIYPEGEDWVKISGNFTASSAGWSQFQVDLAAYAGKSVHFSFYLAESNDYPYAEGPGWFIDDVEILGLAQSTPQGLFILNTDYSAGPPVVNWFVTPFDPEYTTVYTSQNESYLPNLGNRILMTAEDILSFTDNDRPGYEHFYAVGLMDDLMHENLSIHLDPPFSDVSNPMPARSLAELNGNHPNPFNPKTTISFNLAHTAQVRLTIYDVSGRRVATLVDTEMMAGDHFIPFDAGKEASGMYFCRLEADGTVQTKKMMLVR